MCITRATILCQLMTAILLLRIYLHVYAYYSVRFPPTPIQPIPPRKTLVTWFGTAKLVKESKSYVNCFSLLCDLSQLGKSKSIAYIQAILCTSLWNMKPFKGHHPRKFVAPGWHDTPCPMVIIFTEVPSSASSSGGSLYLSVHSAHFWPCSLFHHRKSGSIDEHVWTQWIYVNMLMHITLNRCLQQLDLWGEHHGSVTLTFATTANR